MFYDFEIILHSRDFPFSLDTKYIETSNPNAKYLPFPIGYRPALSGLIPPLSISIENTGMSLSFHFNI